MRIQQQIMPAERRAPARILSLAGTLSSAAWGFSPCEVTLDSLPQPLHTTLLRLHLFALPPPYRGAGAPERRGEGSRGQSLFLFGSRGLLGETWRENGCIRAGVGGQDFNSVKEQLVWVSPHFTFPSLSPQIQGDEKFVQRGTSKIKKVYSPKSLPLPCSSIREECNNVSIWPWSDWLKTRKCCLCFGVLTAGRNLIKKLEKFGGNFFSVQEEFSVSSFNVQEK